MSKLTDRELVKLMERGRWPVRAADPILLNPDLREWPVDIICGICGHKWTENKPPFIATCPGCGYATH